MPFIPQARLLNMKLRVTIFFVMKKALSTSTPATPPPRSIESVLMLDGILFPGGYHSAYFPFTASDHFVHNFKQ